MKIDRLLGIIVYLLNRDIVSGKHLAKKFEVSQRTIQRDIEAIGMAGIPITATPGVGGGYFILESFKMERQLLKDSDYWSIITALQGLASAYQNPGIDSVLEKMTSLSENKHDATMILDFGVLSERGYINERLHQLEQAIIIKKAVSFCYTNAKNETHDWEVEPISLVYKWYTWYLLGYALKKSDYRLYKLVRMNNIQITNNPFSREHAPADDLIQCHEMKDSRQYIDIRLLCKPEARIEAIEYLNGEVEKACENGDVIIKLHLPQNERLWFGTLLSLGNRVEVIEPEVLKRRLCDKCQEILTLYQNG